jgi:hypothetical protein
LKVRTGFQSTFGVQGAAMRQRRRCSGDPLPRWAVGWFGAIRGSRSRIPGGFSAAHRFLPPVMASVRHPKLNGFTKYDFLALRTAG